MTPLIRSTALCAALLWSVVATPCDGAVYYQAEGPLAADFDGDGAVAFADFLLFGQQFGQASSGSAFEARFDLNADGVINFADFLIFTSSFGATGNGPPATPDYALYVLDPGTSTIDVYDVGTHLYQEFLPFRNPAAIVVSADHRRIYVNEEFGLFVLNTRHEVEYSVPASAIGGLAVSPLGDFAYAGERANDFVRVVDLAARATVDTVAVGDAPGSMALSTDGKRLYVLNASSITVVDLEVRDQVAELPVDGRPSNVAIAPSGELGYYTLGNRAAVGVVDLQTNELVGEIQLEGDDTNGMAFSPDGRRLYVNTTTSLVELDPVRNTLIRSLRVGEATSSVALTPDGRWAYVGALEQNVFVPGVAVVDIEAWEVVGRIRGFSFPAELAFRRITD